jgi:hypothetical protein
MVEYVEVVQCKHPNCNQVFTFRAPENSEKKLTVGDRVLVNTSKGPCQMATCITPQFQINNVQLKELYGITDINNLKPVVGYLKPIMFMYCEAAGT